LSAKGLRNPLIKIVYSGPHEQLGVARAAAGQDVEVEWVEAEPDKVSKSLLGADGFIDASMRVSITPEMIHAAPSLRIISCATTGSDHIRPGDRAALKVVTLRDAPDLLANLTPAAELSWALVLACARRLPAAVSHVKNGGWTREEFPGVMLNGRQIGIIGCGRIGGWMLRYAEAFGMDRVGYDPYQDPPPGCQKMDLPTLFETSDVISVHVHLSADTEGLVTQELFECIKPGAIFINTSRGAIADEAAHLKSLEDGRVGAAGLDVLEGEPEVADHPLRLYAETHDNLLITPHCGGFSPDAVGKVVAHATRRAVEYLQSRDAP
jgi:D-3-phosphoglycerate dehydrogenase